MRVNNILKGYSLELAGGQAWHFSSADDASSSVDKLAKAMGLSEGYVPGSTELFYTRSGLAAVIDGAGDLPESGWEPVKLNITQFWFHKETPHVICDIGPEGSVDEEMIKLSLSLYPLYRSIVFASGAAVHAALVERDGGGVLLAGRGGMGKSTCGRRIPPPWRTLSDDTALIVRDNLSHYEVHPLPTWSNFFMGRPQKAWDVREHIILDGIFFLEQAKKDEALSIGAGEAAMRAYDAMFQAHIPFLRFIRAPYDAELKKQLFLNACEMAKAIPSFILRVDLHGRFWEELDKILMEA
jgi:SynChlorMet cassette protein ScmC